MYIYEPSKVHIVIDIFAISVLRIDFILIRQTFDIRYSKEFLP